MAGKESNRTKDEMKNLTAFRTWGTELGLVLKLALIFSFCPGCSHSTSMGGSQVKQHSFANPPGTANPQQQVNVVVPSGNIIPQKLKEMPVLITIPVPGQPSNPWSGSGFYLGQSNGVFLVTAAHVIFHGITNTFKNTNAFLSTFVSGHNPVAKIDLPLLFNKGEVKVDAFHDIAVIRIAFPKKKGGSLTDGDPARYNDFSNYPNAVLITNENAIWEVTRTCQPATNVLEGQDVLLFGYPTELQTAQMKNHLTSDLNFTQPLIRKGIISQKPTTSDEFIIDSGVFGGNSGGPLLVTETIHYLNEANQWVTHTEYNIIGVMIRFVPAKTRVVDEKLTNSVLVYSGYSVAEPIEVAINLMNQFK